MSSRHSGSKPLVPDPPHTPVPTRDLRELTAAVGRIEGRLKSVSEEQLPPVAAAASEARDGVLILQEKQKTNQARIKRLEDAPPVSHDCDKSSTITQHSGKISAQQQELAGLSKWRWWLMGIMVTIIFITVGWATSNARDMATIEVEHSSTKRDIHRHDAEIQAIEKAQIKNREAIIREVRGVPSKVKQVFPEISLEETLEDDKLTVREKQIVREILRRVEQREKGM